MKSNKDGLSTSRRTFLQTTGVAIASAAALPLKAMADSIETQPFDNGKRDLVIYPQKRPLMLITARPPHLETPFRIFNDSVITPNDAFFVRYHLANLPMSIDLSSYRLTVRGNVKSALSLSMEDIKSLAPAVEVVAVNQCSGNSRGYAKPRVFGAQLGNGSMGNARWVGVPLKAILDKAGILEGARQVTFKGLDEPVLPSTPRFIKALNVDHAMSGEPILAWSMNGTDIPFLNGYPIKLIVPGYSGTYWVKHLSEIEILDHEFDGFFMSTAYRVPATECECVPAGTAASSTHPITKLKVRSFITNLKSGDVVRGGQPLEIKGIAFDSGTGIKSVETSTDGGATWSGATLGENLGAYSFRAWSTRIIPSSKGDLTILTRATAQSGEVQPSKELWNPGGYMRNVIETISLVVA